MDFIGPDLGDEISQQIAEGLILSSLPPNVPAGKLDPFTKEPYMKDADPAQYMRDANIYYMEKQLQKQRIGQRAVLSPGPPQKSNHILNFFSILETFPSAFIVFIIYFLNSNKNADLIVDLSIVT